MNPKHHNPTKSNRVAHAPYNFIPLPEKVVPGQTLPSHDRYYPDRHTGYLNCALITKSPVYTRAAMDPKFFARWADNIRELMANDRARETYAQFFHLDDVQRPVIPGSTLRGMTRALIEIAGYGKVQWIDPDTVLIFRAVGDPTSIGRYYRQLFLGPNKASELDMHYDYPSPNVRGGYLIKTKIGYAIQPAQTHKGETFVHVEYSDAEPIIHGQGRQQVHHVFVKPALRQPSDRGKRGKGKLILNIAVTDQISASPKEGLVEAYLVESGHMRGKHAKHHHCAVFARDFKQSSIPIPDELWFMYQEDVKKPRGFPTRRIHENDPLFYLVDENENLIFFGPTQFFRIPYWDDGVIKVNDKVPKHLRESSFRDISEAIFGFVGGSDSRAGRVFFTDAICEVQETDIWDNDVIVTPKILSSPKPTTFQHYLVQDKKRGHDPKNKNELAHYATPTPQETSIRGHKLYWHRGPGPNFAEQQAVDWQSDTQHTQIKPVRPGVTFHFRVYFENLSEEELGALLWVLDLPQDHYHYHKIGMGKPLGLGAVEIKPRLILTDREDRYRKLFGQNTWHEATREEGDVASFKQAFEAYVLKNMDSTERGKAQSLSDVERIQHLLKMLEWPGPSPELTEYMDLKEFRRRPVLPDPLHIQLEVNKGKRASPKPRTPKRGKGSNPKSPSAEQKPQVLQSAQDAREGMIVRGVIEKAETNRFVVAIEKDVPGSLTFENADLQDLSSDTAESYIGMKIMAKIKGINKKGNIQLEALKWE